MRLTQMDLDSFVLGHFTARQEIAQKRDLHRVQNIELAHDPNAHTLADRAPGETIA
jgi:hypothetical protein